MGKRVILFSGKGGVGKTTVAAATGCQCAQLGYKTIILSLDPAHSLADSFDIPVDLHDHKEGLPRQLADNLWIQEIDVQEEVKRWWGDVYQYLATLFRTTGLDEVVAEELAIIPGMEEVVGFLYINQYVKEKVYDAIILDCAPTGETLRFISIPSTLEWYIKKIFPLERNIARLARPFAKMVTDVPIPEDSYFRGLKSLFERLEGIEEILLDKNMTSVRLVTNAEKMVVRETQRAFMYFCMYGFAIDLIVVNRVLPPEIQDQYFQKWLISQGKYLEEIESYFAPVPISRLKLFQEEIVGMKKLQDLAYALYGTSNPCQVFFHEEPYSFFKENSTYIVKLKIPFTTKDHVDLHKDMDGLIIRIGGFKRHIPLPRALMRSKLQGAKLMDKCLTITFEDNSLIR